MKKILFSILFISTFINSLTAENNFNLEDDTAVSGYDLITYFKNKPEKGSIDHLLIHNDIKYLFVNEHNLNLFKNSPDSYIPEYGGWCAYAMLEGEKVGVNPKTYKIVNDKLYLFYNSWHTDTLKLWNNKIKETKEDKLLKLADSKWKDITN